MIGRGESLLLLTLLVLCAACAGDPAESGAQAAAGAKPGRRTADSPPPPAAVPPPGDATQGPGDAAGILRGRAIAPSGRTFEVEVVQDAVSRATGLKRRANLAEGEGMLFVFPEAGPHRFWMYECLIPLDILWLDAAARVIHIEESLPICSALPCPDYWPDGNALYVLELGSGVARKSGIREGDALELLFARSPAPRP